jgi:hypothetical protein
MILYELISNVLGMFPDVEAKNASGPTAIDGTPYIKKVVDDLWGFNQALMDEAVLIPSDNDEATENSQRLSALKKLFHGAQLPRKLSNEFLCSKRWASSGEGSPWGHMWSVFNSISVPSAATAELLDLAVGFDDSDHPLLLVLDAATYQIHKYDTRTGTLVDSSGTLGDLGAGTWRPTALASDSQYVFVMFMDTAAAPNETHKVQKYRISDWVGGAAIGWPSTGVLLSGAGTNPIVGDRGDRILVCTDDYVATLNSWVALSTSGQAGITLINRATGAIVASGAGDVPVGAQVYPTSETGGFVTDGTYLFYIAQDNATTLNTRICSVTITAPTTGIGGAGWPYNLGTTNAIRGLGFDGDIIYSSKAAPDGDIGLHRVSDADSGEIPYFGPEQDVYFDSIFDGKRHWFGITNVVRAGDPGLRSLAVGGVSELRVQNDQPQLNDSRYLFDMDATGAYTPGRLAWDGSNVWYIAERQASETLSGIVRRVPVAMLQ